MTRESGNHVLTCGDWKFWLATDGAVCMEGPDGSGTAMRWEKFEDIYNELQFARAVGANDDGR